MKTHALEERIARRALEEKVKSGLEQPPETVAQEPKKITDAIRYKMFGNNAIVRDTHA